MRTAGPARRPGGQGSGLAGAARPAFPPGPAPAPAPAPAGPPRSGPRHLRRFARTLRLLLREWVGAVAPEALGQVTLGAEEPWGPELEAAGGHGQAADPALGGPIRRRRSAGSLMSPPTAQSCGRT